MPHDIEPGDWLVYTVFAKQRTPLGGPWAYAKAMERGTCGWSVAEGGGKHYVLDRDLLRVVLSRGEASLIVRDLQATENMYLLERDALKPKFEQRISALLNPRNGER